jgi:hypothetical protein
MRMHQSHLVVSGSSGSAAVLSCVSHARWVCYVSSCYVYKGLLYGLIGCVNGGAGTALVHGLTAAREKVGHTSGRVLFFEADGPFFGMAEHAVSASSPLPLVRHAPGRLPGDCTNRALTAVVCITGRPRKKTCPHQNLSSCSFILCPVASRSLVATPTASAVKTCSQAGCICGGPQPKLCPGAHLPVLSRLQLDPSYVPPSTMNPIGKSALLWTAYLGVSSNTRCVPSLWLT